MCELYAIDARRAVEPNEQLSVFFGDSVLHPHGWGLAWHDGPHVHFYKEPVRAMDSMHLRRLLKEPIRTKRLMAHIRNATRGAMSFENSHPFDGTDVTGRRWLFGHNGTILQDDLVRSYAPKTQGTTDSEEVLLYLLDRMGEAAARKGGALGFGDRFEVLRDVVGKLSDGNKLNFVLDDGECTYAHTNTIQHTLYLRQTPDGVIFSTRPLDEGLGWEPVPPCRLVACRHGRVVRVAPSHGHAFDNDRYLHMLKVAV